MTPRPVALADLVNGAKPAPVAESLRTFDLGLVRSLYQRQREDGEMIVALSDTVANLTQENQTLRAELAKLKPPAPAERKGP